MSEALELSDSLELSEDDDEEEEEEEDEDELLPDAAVFLAFLGLDAILIRKIQC